MDRQCRQIEDLNGLAASKNGKEADITRTLLKLTEELGEFASAHNAITTNSYKLKESGDQMFENRKEEAVDVLQCALSLALICMPQAEIEKLLEEKNTKWYNKYLSNK